MKGYPDRGEAAWLERARRGDELAFAELVEAYQVPVYNLCYRMMGDAAEAEEAAQESFWRAYRGLNRYDPSRKFSTWLLSIASHYCIDLLRKRRMQLVSLDELQPWGEMSDPTPGPESSLAHAEQASELRALLNGLGGQDRAAVILRYWYSLSTEEIAATLGLTEKAVKSRLHRARRELGAAYGRIETDVVAQGGRHGIAPAL